MRVRIDIVNAAWQLGEDAVLVRRAAKGDVAAFCECRDRDDNPVPIGRILGTRWRTIQALTSGAKAGCAIAINRSSGLEVRRSRMFLASLAGRGVQTRYAKEVVLVEGDTESHVIVVHNPLRGTGRQDDAARSVARRVATINARAARRQRVRVKARVVRWCVVGDFNMSHDQMRRLIAGTHSVGLEVMGFVYSEGWHDVDLEHRTIRGSDHPVLSVTTT